MTLLLNVYLGQKCVPGQCGTGNVPSVTPVLNAATKLRFKTLGDLFIGNSVKF